ncbi:hypothetical protein DESUT3_09230 [Desulfuromonas versatilis]|uniref:Diguanylate cyclase/phosphodiesterase with PAS/PAC sensor(S) n=1 Tax=Desulfuromonas versatilis TaxID=2802975 RepID=A0ABN6DVG9_9BACT|nr:EAL domain-containing protein [Desulfuromonas versatilis]BCR03854.1 hypothetical protein DESUT3_09230 [Desulfuromonas versatilis]
MKRKINFSLIVLFSLFAFGAGVATLNIKTTTQVFNNLLKLHQIEGLRHGLMERILKVQSDLYTVHTSLGHNLDSIIVNVSHLETAAEECLSCHHRPAVAAELEELQRLVEEFKGALSFYITASANRERIDLLKKEAALLGNRLLYNTEQMSFEAGANIERLTTTALIEVERARWILFATLLLSGLVGVLVARHLSRSITRPTAELVHATRCIAAGELGYAIETQFDDEFGELASNLNSMSASLKSGYTKLQQEIAERRLTEAALLESQERYALAAQGANDGLWDWDLRANRIHYSPRWKAMLGLQDEQGAAPAVWLERVHPDDRRHLEAKINAHIDGQTTHFESEFRILHQDGSYRWMLTRGLAVREVTGRAYRMAGSQTEITERKKAEEQLLHDAFHDALTDLPNRALFKNRLQQVFGAAQRNGDFAFAVLFLDLDRFKLINDSLGHLAGDQLLIAVGKRMLGVVRPNDTVARLGGDEFAILLQDIRGLDDAIHIAERIQKELPKPFTIGGHEVFSTASIGISLHSAGHERPEQMLRDADLAMYHAKANGKARYEIYDARMHADTVTHMRVENDLRRAIERKEFQLYYQPILSLASNRITGFEALIRWQHPERGLMAPAEFISIAEETGLITPMGQWALREACSKLSQWQRHGLGSVPLTVNLNLSGKEFTPALLQQIKELLQEMDIAPGTLRLEITESTIMGEPESSAFLLHQLKAMGIGLQIDDFGTGYSSLSYLHQFPIDALKIDRSFVSMMSIDRENLEIIKTIVNLAHNLGMDVIAEGVEKPEELRILKQLGCEYAQGFLISRPIEADSVATLIGREADPDNHLHAGSLR